MTLRQYINHLEQLAREQGDNLTVQTYDSYGGRRNALPPELAHERINHGRESKLRFYYSFDGEDRRGAPCIRV